MPWRVRESLLYEAIVDSLPNEHVINNAGPDQRLLHLSGRESRTHQERVGTYL